MKGDQALANDLGALTARIFGSVLGILAVPLGPHGPVGTVQIAGLVARRILCWGEEGHALGQGERFGLIRFGSRVDVFLPDGASPRVALGQTMIAGETILAAQDDVAPSSLNPTRI